MSIKKEKDLWVDAKGNKGTWEDLIFEHIKHFIKDEKENENLAVHLAVQSGAAMGLLEDYSKGRLTIGADGYSPLFKKLEKTWSSNNVWVDGVEDKGEDFVFNEYIACAECENQAEQVRIAMKALNYYMMQEFDCQVALEAYRKIKRLSNED